MTITPSWGDAPAAVIGHGSWATALVKILIESGRPVGWYIRNPQVLDGVRAHGSNPRYLRDVHFDGVGLEASSDIDEVVGRAGLVVLAVPSAYLKQTLEPLTVPLRDKFVVSAIKGIVPGDNITVAEYVAGRYGVPPGRTGILTGPCHAEEVAQERLSYLTAVCADRENAAWLAGRIRCRYINATASGDMLGAEYAAVLKNIYAIAVGIAVGLGYGDNFNAVLISNAAMEMNRFLSAVYPYPREPSASVYLGDLLVTSYSQFSRNRTFGAMIGKGYGVRAAKVETSQVAEGYFASECVARINEAHGVDMPIAGCVYDILYRGASPARKMKELTEKLI